MMSNVIEFKTRSELLSDWLKEVINQNGLLEQDVQSALLVWEKKDKDGTSTCMHARYNCDIDNFEWFKRCIEEQSFRNRVAKYLKENINDFVEYIN